jgi:hypothetical protein
MADVATRPTLTMPPDEAEALRAAYAGAGTVLEYGSGGSTVLAAELGATVWSVESDPDWAAMMRDWLANHPAKGRAHVVHIDVGPTKAWGYPRDEAAFRQWPDYPMQVWDMPGFTHPDVVLVDGRFRLACFLTVAHRITRPCTLFFDDYAPRAAYHKAEALCRPTRMIGRMAQFDLTPVPLTPDRMRAYVKALLLPN